MAKSEPLQIEVTLGNEHALVTGVTHLPMAVTQIGDQFLVQLGSTEAFITREAGRRIGRVFLFDPPAPTTGEPDNQPVSQHDDGPTVQQQAEGVAL